MSIAKPAVFRKPGDRLNMAFIGSGGRGGANLKEFYDLGEQIVAVCDVDRGRLNHSANVVKERCPDVRKYQDFRELLATEKDLDAVVVSTPDHMHAAAAIAAMKQGCHVYVEKPLVRTVWEARRFAEVAKACGVMTQMGNNGKFRITSAAISRSCSPAWAISARSMFDRPSDLPQAINRRRAATRCRRRWRGTAGLGIAPERPTRRMVSLFKWRGWFDFAPRCDGRHRLP